MKEANWLFMVSQWPFLLPLFDQLASAECHATRRDNWCYQNKASQSLSFYSLPSHKLQQQTTTTNNNNSNNNNSNNNNNNKSSSSNNKANPTSFTCKCQQGNCLQKRLQSTPRSIYSKQRET